MVARELFLARTALVQEGGQWKIDVPDSVDANQLSQGRSRARF